MKNNLRFDQDYKLEDYDFAKATVELFNLAIVAQVIQ